MNELIGNAFIIYRDHSVIRYQVKYLLTALVDARKHVLFFSSQEPDTLRPHFIHVGPAAVTVIIPSGFQRHQLCVRKIPVLYRERQRQYALEPLTVIFVKITVLVHVRDILHGLFEYLPVGAVYHAVLIAQPVAVEIRPRKVRPGDRSSKTSYIEGQNRQRIYRVEHTPEHFRVEFAYHTVAVEITITVILVGILEKPDISGVDNPVTVYIRKGPFLGGYIQLVIKPEQ